MIFEFYCLVLINMFCIADFNDPMRKEEPLLMAYYPNDQIFATIDPITISNAVNQEYKRIIIGFCPISNLPTYTSLLVNENVWKSDAYDESLQNFKCYSPVKSFFAEHTSLPYYRVSYQIFFDFNLLNDYEMKTGNLSTAVNYAGKRIFFFELFRFHFLMEYLENTGSLHRIVIYRRDENQQQRTKCQKEDMKSNHYNIKNIFENLYNMKKQKKNIKKNFNWPKSFKKGVPDEYFIMHQMVPIEDFVDKVTGLITCMYYNTAPLWKSVSTGRMKRVEEYIRTVAKNLSPNTLLIGTIPIDALEAKKKGTRNENIFYLDMKNKKIPVPKLIVKVIIYRAPWLNGGKTGERGFYSKKDEYAIAIVVHNELGNEIQKVCGSDLGEGACTKYGWLVSDNEKDKGVYCCEINDEFFNNKFENINLESPKIFDLNNVLWTRGEGETKDEFRNIAKDIYSKTELIPEK